MRTSWLGCSQSRTAAKCDSPGGMTPLDWQGNYPKVETARWPEPIEVRFEGARHLVADTNIPLQVSAALDFSAPAALTRAFQRWSEVSPSELRSTAESRLAPRRDAWPRSARGSHGVIPPSCGSAKGAVEAPPGTIHNEQRPEGRSLGSLPFRAPKQAR